MTVANSTSRSGPYAGASQTGPFPVTFRFLENAHLQVVQANASDVETTLVLDTNYTVTGAGSESGGTLTLLVALPVGQTLTIIRDVPITQLTDYTQSDSFPAESHEDALDKLTMIAQQQQDDINRSIRVPEFSTVLPELPAAATRAGYLLGFDGAGAPTIVSSVAGSATALALSLLSSIGSTLVMFLQAGVGTVLRTLQSKLRGIVEAEDFGVVADSNGTTGNGTDNTVALQNAINYAASVQRTLWLPKGTVRFTGELDLTAGGLNGIEYSIRGVSTLGSRLFADFTSAVTKKAALKMNNSLGTRAYVKLSYFYLFGVSDANVAGIYFNYTSSYCELNNILVQYFYNNIELAHDYYTKFIGVQSNYAINNGVQIGYLLDRVTLAQCNGISFYGGDYSGNAIGIYARSARTISFFGTTSEGNTVSNWYLELCYGIAIVGCYAEIDPALVATPIAQVYLLNCNGASIDGFAVSSFKHDSSPIIYLEGCNGVSITGYAVDSAGGPFAAVGLKLKGSFGVSLQGSIISDVTTSIYFETASRLGISDTTFLNYTFPIASGVGVAYSLYWRQATAAQVAASSIVSAASVDIDYIDNTKCKLDELKTFNVVVNFSDMSAGASKNLILHTLLSEQWRIADIIAVNTTAFNAGGDRLVVVTDGTHSYTLMTAATLKTGNNQARWGSASVPYSATPADMTLPTTAASNLVAKYSGGATDYTSGVCNLTIVAQRVA